MYMRSRSRSPKFHGNKGLIQQQLLANDKLSMRVKQRSEPKQTFCYRISFRWTHKNETLNWKRRWSVLCEKENGYPFLNIIESDYIRMSSIDQSLVGNGMGEQSLHRTITPRTTIELNIHCAVDNAENRERRCFVLRPRVFWIARESAGNCVRWARSLEQSKTFGIRE